MWGIPALDSPLGQVVFLEIWCLPQIRFHWFALLSPQDTGHCWVHLFWLVLVAVDLIQAPASLEKPSSRKGSRQTECQAWKLRGWGQSERTGTSFSFSKGRDDQSCGHHHRMGPGALCMLGKCSIPELYL